MSDEAVDPNFLNAVASEVSGFFSIKDFSLFSQAVQSLADSLCAGVPPAYLRRCR